MDPLQAKAVLILAESKHFDTAEIALLLKLQEAEVARLIQASRDVRRGALMEGAR